MAIINPPSWAQNGSYTAKMDRQVVGGFIGTAGVTSATSYAISQTGPSPTMYVTIQAGSAYIQGTEQADQGMYHVFNEDSFDVNIVTSDSVNSRIDLVCIRVYDSEISGTQNLAFIDVIQGDPSSSPVVPATPASAIPLAQITVPANATAIVNSNIVDVRPVAKFQTSLTRNFVQKPEPWRSPGVDGLYAANWVDYPNAFQKVYFRRFAGNVEITGLARAVASIPNNTTQTIFTLPSGYRPAGTTLARGLLSTVTITTGTQSSGTAHTHPATMALKTARIQISTGGLVQLYVGHTSATYGAVVPSAAWLSLTGISFPIA